MSHENDHTDSTPEKDDTWKFVDGAEPVETADWWYDLTDGGYIIDDVLALLEHDDQRDEVLAAVTTLMSLRDCLEESGLLVFQ